MDKQFSYANSWLPPDNYVQPARSRITDPVTSASAAHAQTPETRNELFLALLEAIDNASPDGLTIWEACQRSGIEIQSGSPRFCQMRRLGLIEIVGKRKNPNSGRMADVYKRIGSLGSKRESVLDAL